MKKLLALLLVVVLVLSCFAGCASGEKEIKVGLICLHDENSPYDKNFIDSFKKVADQYGYKAIIVTNIPEDEHAYTAAVELVDDGCSLIFADSFGHEAHILKAAQENPNVEFCHATGVTALDSGVKNFHNAFAQIYDGRFLAGVAGGMKLKELIDAGKVGPECYEGDNVIIGYVGAFNYAEVRSGMTSWYLGVKSIVPNVVMKVQYTGSWYTLAGEKQVAETFVNTYHCALISQHADSMGAPSVCEDSNVPNIAYNYSNAATCEDTYICGSKINWDVYFDYVFDAIKNGTEIVPDYIGTLKGGDVAVLELGKNAAAGTAEKLEEVKAKLISGEIKTFDLDTFTYNGAKLTADAFTPGQFTDGNWTDAKKAATFANGAFVESAYRSGPIFDIVIDGITELN